MVDNATASAHSHGSALLRSEIVHLAVSRFTISFDAVSRMHTVGQLPGTELGEAPVTASGLFADIAYSAFLRAVRERVAHLEEGTLDDLKGKLSAVAPTSGAG